MHGQGCSYMAEKQEAIRHTKLTYNCGDLKNAKCKGVDRLVLRLPCIYGTCYIGTTSQAKNQKLGKSSIASSYRPPRGQLTLKGVMVITFKRCSFLFRPKCLKTTSFGVTTMQLPTFNITLFTCYNLVTITCNNYHMMFL